MNKKEMIFFKLANYTLLLTAIFHLLGHFIGFEPSNPTEIELKNLMVNYYFNLSPVRTMMDLYLGFSLDISIFTFLIAFINLAFIFSDYTDTLFKKISLINLVFFVIITINTIIYHILPPMICYSLATLFFAISYLVHLRKRN